MRKIYFAAGVLAGAVLLGAAGTRVGGVMLRNTVTRNHLSALQVSGPMVPGVPAVVRWATVTGGSREKVGVYVRTGAEEIITGTAEWQEGRAWITLPCEAQGQRVTLLMRSTDTRAVLATTETGVLSGGPECALGILR